MTAGTDPNGRYEVRVCVCVCVEFIKSVSQSICDGIKIHHPALPRVAGADVAAYWYSHLRRPPVTRRSG